MPLSVSHVSFDYSARAARTDQATPFSLNDVSVTVERGSVTGLLGPNGCGKTTLLKLCAGILRPGRGRVMFDGLPLDAWPKRALAQRIALVPQETYPTFDYTALEMVLMGRHPYLGPFRLEGPADIAIARDALATTGTAHLADRLFSTLSGGEKQRVVIASALAQEPDVLLLDEPTSSLDLAFELEVFAVLERLNREHGVTIVMATHDLNLAAALCHSLIVMRSGQVRAHGAAHEVLTSGMVRDVYDVEAAVRRDEVSGQLMIVPYRHRR